MFWLSKFKEYGMRIVTGDFWAGKTKNLYQDAFLRKQKYPDWLLIANIPYDFIDLHFSSKEDLDKIIEFINLYIQATNTFDRFKEKDFPYIRIIIDEAHLYFFSRDFKSMNKTHLLMLTQCRKRFIQVDFITQELAQLDVFMRRLMPYVMNYEKRIFGLHRASMYYFKVSEVSDIGDEMNVEKLETEYLMPDKIQQFFNPKLKNYFDQRFLTYYVIGSNSVLQDYTFNKFMNLLEKHRLAFKEQILLLSKKRNVRRTYSKIIGPVIDEKELYKDVQPISDISDNRLPSHKISTSFSEYIWRKLFGSKYLITSDFVNKSNNLVSLEKMANEKPDES